MDRVGATGSLEGRTALLIGGSSGMGRGAARALAARGASVVVTSHSVGRLDDAVGAVSSDLVPVEGVQVVGEVRGVVCDLGDPDSVRGAVESLPIVDHLVVTAAPGRGLTDRQFFEGKFWGTQVAAEAAAARMPEDGTMVFTSGGLAVRPAKGEWSTSCAFAAVEALARSLAVELAPRRVTCIRPGLFDTGTWADMEPHDRRSFFERQTEGLPVRRPGTEEDFGDAVVGILRAHYLTGQVISLDGGKALTGG